MIYQYQFVAAWHAKWRIINMPCWTVSRTSVALELARPDLIDAAIKALGATRIAPGVFNFEGATYRIANGQLTGRGDVNALANRLKVAYSKEAIKATAQRFGWRVTQDAKQDNKLQVTRRY